MLEYSIMNYAKEVMFYRLCVSLFVSNFMQNLTDGFENLLISNNLYPIKLWRPSGSRNDCLPLGLFDILASGHKHELVLGVFEV